MSEVKKDSWGREGATVLFKSHPRTHARRRVLQTQEGFETRSREGARSLRGRRENVRLFVSHSTVDTRKKHTR